MFTCNLKIERFSDGMESYIGLISRSRLLFNNPKLLIHPLQYYVYVCVRPKKAIELAHVFSTFYHKEACLPLYIFINI